MRGVKTYAAFATAGARHLFVLYSAEDGELLRWSRQTGRAVCAPVRPAGWPHAIWRVPRRPTLGLIGTGGQAWRFKQLHNHLYEGRSVAEVAAMRDQHPVDAPCDLLLKEDLQTTYTALSGDASSLPRFLAHPLSMGR